VSLAVRAGAQYPRSIGEFQSWFSTDADCADYLEWLRWPEGFVCSACGHAGGWRLGDGRWECAACSARTSATAGTIFDRTRTPLTVWFTACWLFATQKDGISALSLKRSLEIGSYQTAWAMLHRLRSVLVRPGRDQLRGRVEVDETYIGGEELGLRGGRQKGKKVMVAVAVERIDPRGFGRCRMAPINDGSADSLRAFLHDNIEPGATVITDGWQPYRPATRDLYVHQSPRRRVGTGGVDAAPRRAQGLLAGQAMAAGHPPGVRGGRAPPQLSQRVCVPLYPPSLSQPWAGVQPRARARRRPRPGALPRAHPQSPARPATPPASEQPRPPSQHRATARRPTIETTRVPQLRLDGYPICSLIRLGKRIPHARHWESLTEAASSSEP
jgi:hypothetical protein